MRNINKLRKINNINGCIYKTAAKLHGGIFPHNSGVSYHVLDQIFVQHFTLVTYL